MDAIVPSALEKRLLQEYQRGLPLAPRPYAAIARRLGVEEADIMAALHRLLAAGAIGRIGAVLRPGSVGASTLAAMAVPADRLEEVAARVSAEPGVNHNYERGHDLNLWFVVTAPTEAEVSDILRRIEADTGIAVADLRLEEEYRIDLGFALSWT